MTDETNPGAGRSFVTLANGLLGRIGLSVNRKTTIDELCREVDYYRVGPTTGNDGVAPYAPDSQALSSQLEAYEAELARYSTDEDFEAAEKRQNAIDSIEDIGASDFAELAWLFSSSLSNHRFIRQRFDEAALLWRAVKMSAGPILEIGRAAGGSTVCILGASGRRSVVSIDSRPEPSDLVEKVFARPDVANRLTLYSQSSREAIAEDEFGLIFFDGDSSYEGICHDIARYWNDLTPQDGKPAIAVFHGASENPIAFEVPVKIALDELLETPGVARVVESAGSTLVVEKLSDVDAAAWYVKEDPGAWAKFAPGRVAVLPEMSRRPSLRIGRIVEVEQPNLLGTIGLFQDEWTRVGVTMKPLPTAPDSPMRFVVEDDEDGPHRLQSFVSTDSRHMAYRALVRPVGVNKIHLSLNKSGAADGVIMRFEFAPEPKIEIETERGCTVTGASLNLVNGYFDCQFSVETEEVHESTRFVIEFLDDSGSHYTTYPGSPRRGLVLNTASVRTVSGFTNDEDAGNLSGSEEALLWRTLKRSAGPVLEVGRTAGNGTIDILDASGERPVVSVARDPRNPFVANSAFDAPDVSKRLTLYNQTQREEIDQDEFGTMVVYAERSYDDICHAIARYWNSLKTYDRKSPIAIFDGVATNPAAFDESVRQALDELLEDPGVARISEQSGSLLVVEKLSDIDRDDWFGREDAGQWTELAPDAGALMPESGGRPDMRIGRAVDVDLPNILGSIGRFNDEWTSVGLTMEPLPFAPDSPMRIVRENESDEGHRLQAFGNPGTRHFSFRVLVRPLGVNMIHLSANKSGTEDSAVVRFEFEPEPSIDVEIEQGCKVTGAGIELMNGFYACDISVETDDAHDSMRFVIECLDGSSARFTSYPGSPDRGLILNQTSVRAVTGYSSDGIAEGADAGTGADTDDLVHAHVGRALSRVDVQADGFPHLVADNVLPRHVLEDVNAYWPDLEMFTPEVKGNSCLHFKNTSRYDPMDAETAAYWKSFSKNTFPEILAGVADKFDPIISKVFGPAVYDALEFGIPFTLMEADADFDGHSKHNHFYHNPNWVFTLLFYVDLDDTISPGTTLSFLERKSSDPEDDNRTRLLTGDDPAWWTDAAMATMLWDSGPYFFQDKEVNYAPNRLLAFVDGPLALHSVRFLQPGSREKVRRTHFDGQRSRRRIMRTHISVKEDAFAGMIEDIGGDTFDWDRFKKVMAPNAALSEADMRYRDDTVGNFFDERLRAYASAAEELDAGNGAGQSDDAIATYLRQFQNMAV